MSHFNQPLPGRGYLPALLFIFFGSSLFGQALSGTYTIGGNTSHYKTIRAAIHALDSFGVSGPVIFNIKSGTYHEGDTISPIGHTSLRNTVTFQSASADSSDVAIEWDSRGSGNWTLRLYRSQYIIFKGITFRQLYDQGSQNLLLVGGHDIRFENCLFEGSDLVFDGRLMAGFVDSNLTVKNCSFRFAKMGIELKSASEKEIKNISLQGNHFHTEVAGIRLFNVCQASISQNQFTNLIGGPHTALNVVNAHQVNIFNNLFHLQLNEAHSRALSLDEISADSGTYCRIYNNVVNATARNQKDVRLLNVGNCRNTIIAYNTFRLRSTGPEQTVIGITPKANGMTNCYFYNNIAANEGPGVAYFTSVATRGELHSDYNLLFAQSGNIGFGALSLDSLQKADSSNFYSVSENPLFRNDDDLHSATSGIDSNAFALPGFSFDFEGKQRNPSYPDIGAFEILHPPVIHLPKDTSSCAFINLSAGSNARHYKWNTGDTTGSIEIKHRGIYWVKASNDEGSDSDTIRVEISEHPSIEIRALQYELQQGQCTQLTLHSREPVQNYEIAWSDVFGFISSAPDPVVCPQSLPARYVVRLTDDKGCETLDSIEIIQAPTQIHPEIDHNQKDGSIASVSPASVAAITGSQEKKGAIKPTAASAAMLYPNPACTSMTVMLLSAGSKTPVFKICDLAGHSFAVNARSGNGGEEFLLDIAPLSEGSYILSIQTEKENYHLSFSKISF